MDMADLIAEIKTLKAKVKEIEDRGGSDAKVEALEVKIDALEKKLSKPLEDSDFDPWD